MLRLAGPALLNGIIIIINHQQLVSIGYFMSFCRLPFLPVDRLGLQLLQCRQFWVFWTFWAANHNLLTLLPATIWQLLIQSPKECEFKVYIF